MSYRKFIGFFLFGLLSFYCFTVAYADCPSPSAFYVSEGYIYTKPTENNVAWLSVHISKDATNFHNSIFYMVYGLYSGTNGEYSEVFDPTCSYYLTTGEGYVLFSMKPIVPTTFYIKNDNQRWQFVGPNNMNCAGYLVSNCPFSLNRN